MKLALTEPLRNNTMLLFKKKNILKFLNQELKSVIKLEKSFQYLKSHKTRLHHKNEYRTFCFLLICLES